MAEAQKDSAGSVEDILSEIKNVISGDDAADDDENLSAEEGVNMDDDIMELTEIADGDEEGISQAEGVTEELADDNIDDMIENQQSEKDEEEFVDILQEIDESVADNANMQDSDQIEEDNMAVDNNAVQEEDILDMSAMMEPEKGAEEAESSEEEVLDLDAMVENGVDSTEASEAEGDNSEIISADEPALVQEEVEIASNTSEDSQAVEEVISEESANKTSAAIKELMNTIPKTKIDSPELRNGVTLEDIVREAISPMLKDWLDQNLEIVVKDIVQKEIKKILPDD